jgi:hypothetical protein
MKKDFESRFMPDVKFKIPVECIKQFDFGLGFPAYGVTSTCGYSIPYLYVENERHLFTNRIDTPLVSIYEAIPELIPDGMRYNKELDKLVSDAIEDKKSVAEQYFVGIDLRKKEIINERKNGFIKADLEKLDFSLVDPFAYSDLAFQLTVGAKKYSKDNWKKGDINIYLSALERHLQDIKKALDNGDIEDLIDDTGIQHGGALLCNSMFIHYFIRQTLKDKNVK